MSPIIVLQTLTSILLLLAILVQANGTSLGRSFGATTSYHTKRGAEKAIFNSTIVLGIIFVALALLNLILNR